MPAQGSRSCEGVTRDTRGAFPHGAPARLLARLHTRMPGSSCRTAV